MIATQESVIVVKNGEEVVAIVHKNGSDNLKVYMTHRASWEDYEKLLNNEKL